jgi:hypothetical protein
MPAVPQRFCTAATAPVVLVRPLNSIVRPQRTLMKYLLIAVAFFACATAAYSAGVSGSVTDAELLSQCTGSKTDAEKCKIYVAGVRAGMSAQRHYIGYTFATQKSDSSAEDQMKLLMWLTTREPFCAPEEISDQDLISAFIAHMKAVKKDHPEEAGKVSGAVSVLLGGQSKYACTPETIGLSRP